MKKIILMWNLGKLKYAHIDMHDGPAVLTAVSKGFRYAGPAKVATMTECAEYREEYAALYGSNRV